MHVHAVIFKDTQKFWLQTHSVNDLFMLATNVLNPFGSNLKCL